METVLALGSAVELAEDDDEALAFDEGEASSEPLESCDSLSFEEVDESSLLDDEESVGVVLTASSSQALRLRASRSAVGRAMRADVFVRMGQPWQETVAASMGRGTSLPLAGGGKSGGGGAG